MNNNLIVTILAGGEGKRMNSDLPKVLHNFNGKPILVKILEEIFQLKPITIIVVVGKHYNLIRSILQEYIDISTILFIQQNIPLGTGDAIKCCLPFYNINVDTDKNVLIINGDMPLIQFNILQKFINNSIEFKINILVANLIDSTGYGRIIYNEKNEFIKIVEEKDCNDIERKIKIVNTGIYLINSELLKQYIPMIENNNIQQEYYLTDIVKIIKKNTDIYLNTHLLDMCNNIFILGVNTQEELKKLEKLLL